MPFLVDLPLYNGDGNVLMQHRLLLGEILMSTPALEPPSHYIPTFDQHSTFISLERNAIVSKLPIRSKIQNAHLLLAAQGF